MVRGLPGRRRPRGDRRTARPRGRAGLAHDARRHRGAVARRRDRRPRDREPWLPFFIAWDVPADAASGSRAGAGTVRRRSASRRSRSPATPCGCARGSAATTRRADPCRRRRPGRPAVVARRPTVATRIAALTRPAALGRARASRSAIRSSGCSMPDREADRASVGHLERRAGDARVRHRPRHLDQGLDAPEGLGEEEQLGSARRRRRPRSRVGDRERSPSRRSRRICRAATSCPGASGRPG